MKADRKFKRDLLKQIYKKQKKELMSQGITFSAFCEQVNNLMPVMQKAAQNHALDILKENSSNEESFDLSSMLVNNSTIE